MEQISRLTVLKQVREEKRPGAIIGFELNEILEAMRRYSNMEKLCEDIKERMIELENRSQDELTQGRIQELSLIMIKVQEYLLEEFNLNNEI